MVSSGAIPVHLFLVFSFSAVVDHHPIVDTSGAVVVHLHVVVFSSDSIGHHMVVDPILL